MNDALLDSLTDEDLPELLAAVHCRNELKKLSESNPPCCTRQALLPEPPPPGSKHYKKAVCSSYGRFFGWISKPKNLAHRAPSTTGLTPEGRCAICLSGQSLEVHHIVEIQDGGSNDPANRLTLCQGCHALVHWVRRYRSGS
jgi:5-methylcytosine-specific restriction endonuclease McrA